MALPAGFLEELNSRISLAQVVGRKVVWDVRKSNRGRGDMWAPCPFHQEKTPSFHVDDRKGVYYCFGCHAKGNAITFVCETENVPFVEAVEILAREAGMEIPAPDPKEREKANRQADLVNVMEQAVRHYRLQLKTASATAAREYLSGRGLSGPAIDHWEIGFASDRRRGLYEHLIGKSVAADLIIAAGLAAVPDDGGAPYDRFRGRIIFPIRDGRGRAIALGGRAMNPDARAKYLNSPDTELFDKGRMLFNFGPARTAVGKGQPLIVAEGYMDVIALHEAGFTGAVAPLGTAVTAPQLARMWSIAPEPIIALDGDRAGLGAAMRLVDLALPSLAAERSLRFCVMPPGKDPDDVIRAGGAVAMRRELDRAQPLFAMLWERETRDREFAGPEERVALEKRLGDAIGRITDPTLRRHYFQEVKDRLFSMRRRTPAATQRGGQGAGSGGQALERTKRSPIMTVGSDMVLESQLLATVIEYPDVLPGILEDLEAVEFVDPFHDNIAGAMVTFDGAASELRVHLVDRVGAQALEQFLSQPHITFPQLMAEVSELEYVHSVITDTLKVVRARRAAESEASEAGENRDGLTSEIETSRLKDAAEALFRAESGPKEDRIEYDIAPSGAKMIRAERNELERAISGTSARPARAR